jgi:DNA adenine methylase
MPKTPITYYGGKINLLSEILPRIPEHRVYIEPYFGGGAVFFAKEPSEAEVINDTNAMVVNFYEVVKSDFEKLKAKIEATPFSRDIYRVALTMYRVPNLFNKLQQAWAFYVGTNMGFSCKIGSWGFDRYNKRVKAFRNKKLIFNEEIVKRLENVQIENLDALKVIVNRDAEDVMFYLDPPYPNSDQGHYSGFSEEDFENLLKVLSVLKGNFLLSSFPNKTLEKYTKKYGWHTQTFGKPLSASNGALSEKRKRKVEVLTANYPI